VIEFGCGTGQLAERLLERHLPRDARYLGVDVSSTMVELTLGRVVRFGPRAEVRTSGGAMKVDAADGSCDRFVSTYVLDLLSHENAHALLDEARRLLEPDGLLCLVSLSHGSKPLSHLVAHLWERIQRIAPVRVGGCRPIRLAAFLPFERWDIEYRVVITMLGVPAEVVVARKLR